MKLVYTGLGGHIISCLIDETIFQIKERIAALEGIRRDQVKINSFGFPMMDSVTLYDLEAGDGVEIIVFVPSGKYRGVLVCDGKVKGQIRKCEIHFL